MWKSLVAQSDLAASMVATLEHPCGLARRTIHAMSHTERSIKGRSNLLQSLTFQRPQSNRACRMQESQGSPSLPLTTLDSWETDPAQIYHHLSLCTMRLTEQAPFLSWAKNSSDSHLEIVPESKTNDADRSDISDINRSECCPGYGRASLFKTQVLFGAELGASPLRARRTTPWRAGPRPPFPMASAAHRHHRRFPGPVPWLKNHIL